MLKYESIKKKSLNQNRRPQKIAITCLYATIIYSRNLEKKYATGLKNKYKKSF